MFESESGTAPGVNLDAITDRMEVRRALQGGDVESAIERVNDLDPEVSGAWACVYVCVCLCACAVFTCEGVLLSPPAWRR